MLYTVRAGDTMSAIANRMNVTLAQLKAANPQIKDPNHIVLGQIIYIPWHSWAPSP
jgi:LysM repeat protein